eukprot:TRINITY_DN6641_c0_g1_i5.p1 TRINITY_DN6641_c0_g1~~TRINITY_DN6641_c0_g1_i5.p1  ORF type:complete len:112 (+),score=33.28 TRINITY_DN6641_c0_g1_i5:319-654(+)
MAAELAGFQQGMLGAAPPMSSAETSEALGAGTTADDFSEMTQDDASEGAYPAPPEMYSSPSAASNSSMPGDLQIHLMAAELAGFQQGMLGAAPPMSSPDTSDFSESSEDEL